MVLRACNSVVECSLRSIALIKMREVGGSIPLKSILISYSFYLFGLLLSYLDAMVANCTEAASLKLLSFVLLCYSGEDARYTQNRKYGTYRWYTNVIQ
ncbi:hypothetical protein BDV23DRAFT_18817 [Aspergillus alliaceus]|uniref:Uncharacterized protein n=1 Tax=Petromyces alliaceus TaxID=209559 RepID=A0A5N7BUX8_PETAA|nr:hypothetical protein BDV23DRAFT_18817 [Aspergillus alliaceus]